MRTLAVLTMVLVISTGCAGVSGMEAHRGYCQVTRCTGVCLDQVQQFAREKLGTEAQNVYFSWDGPDGGTNPASPAGGTAYFTTPECTTGEYHLDFYGNEARCTQTFYGRVPDFVGKLLVVPEGCAGST